MYLSVYEQCISNVPCMYDFEFLFECDFSVDDPGPASVEDISGTHGHRLFLGSDKMSLWQVKAWLVFCRNTTC